MSRGARAITAVIAVLVVAALAGYLLYGRSQDPALARPSIAAATSTPTAPPATTAPATTAPPSATIPPYVNPEYKFSVTLPVPYRKSARLSLSNTGSQNPAAPVALDAFTARTEQDEAALAEQRCGEIACPIRNYVATVEIYTGVSQTPRQWYTSRGGAVGERIDDTTVDGRTAIRVTNGVPTYVPMQLIMKDGDRIFVVGYQIFQNMAVPAGTSKEKLDQILASFRFAP